MMGGGGVGVKQKLTYQVAKDDSFRQVMAGGIQQQATMREARLVLNGGVVDDKLPYKCPLPCIQNKFTINIFCLITIIPPKPGRQEMVPETSPIATVWQLQPSQLS